MHPDGTLDEAFVFAGRGVSALLAQDDGKNLIGGWFDEIDGVPRAGVASLNPNGSLDSNFTPGLEGKFTVSVLELQPDGKVLVGGWAFYNAQGERQTPVARLNLDGTRDTTFNSEFPSNWDVQTMALQCDGKILLGAEDGELLRLNPDGSMDDAFAANLPRDLLPDSIFALSTTEDGFSLVGGMSNRTRRSLLKASQDLFEWTSVAAPEEVMDLNGNLQRITSSIRRKSIATSAAFCD